MKLLSLTIPLISILICHKGVDGNTEEYRLLKDLFERADGNYNPRVRPVRNGNISLAIDVGFEVALIQLINLDERNQIMKTNIWLRYYWCDYELQWDPKDYGEIKVFRIQPSKVWKPDIVLLNNADGRFEVSFKANVLVYPNGNIQWIPCTIYKSSCSIDVTYFPFDEQTCELKFGSWTYNANEVTMSFHHKADPEKENSTEYTEIDVSNFEPSGSWDLVELPGRKEMSPPDKDGLQKMFRIYKVKWRRKTLYYAVNLIIPCVLISTLSIAIFFLPSDSGEKISLGVSILLALVVFLQVLVTNLLPPSSRSFPLFARYLLFTVIIDVLAIINTIMVLNWNFKTPRTHRMPRWVRKVFFGFLPRLLLMKSPSAAASESKSPTSSFTSHCTGGTPLNTPLPSRRNAVKPPEEFDLSDVHHPSCPRASGLHYRGRRKRASGEHGIDDDDAGEKIEPEVNKAIEAVRFISAHLKNEDDYNEVIDDWRYIALVIDRILFCVYIVASIVMTMFILPNAPQIYQAAVNQTALKEEKIAIYNSATEPSNCPWDPKS